MQASPSLISLQNGYLEPAKQGRVNFSVQSGLHQWAYTPSSPIVANINASQVSLAELARAANSNTPVSGTLDARIALHGTQLNPDWAGGYQSSQRQHLGRTHPGGGRALSGNRRYGTRESAGASRCRIGARPAHLLPQAGRLRGAVAGDQHSSRSDTHAARAQHAGRRHFEPDRKRTRHAERSARPGFAHDSAARHPEAADTQH